MEIFEALKIALLRNVYRISPFELSGDGWFADAVDPLLKLSCVINFYGRLDLLDGILHSLVGQVFPRNNFEVILVEDQAGTEEGRAFCNSFADRLNIRYLPLDSHFGHMGYSRNFGLAHAQGEYVLFLDDDTVILQPDFLQNLVNSFEAKPEADAFMPHGQASFSLLQDKYDFHDPFFLTSRCAAYRRAALESLGGFMSNFVGQEDVEFVIRFTLAGKSASPLPQLSYFHPPLLIPNRKKPTAVGISFARLKGRYPGFLLWLVALNCSRHLVLWLSPKRKHREMARFGAGFLQGFFRGWFRPESEARYG